MSVKSAIRLFNNIRDLKFIKMASTATTTILLDKKFYSEIKVPRTQVHANEVSQ